MIIPKKITFVIGSLGKGGAERVVSILANKMIELDYDVSIILFYDDRIDYYIDKRIKLYYIECSKDKNLLSRTYNRINNLRSCIKEISPNIVISFLTEINIFTILAIYRLNIPLIISERNNPYNDPEQKILRILRRVLYGFCNGIVYQTEDAAGFFKYLKQRPSKIIANPIIDNLPLPSPNIERKKKIVTFCRLTSQKNLPLLIDGYDGLNEYLKKQYILEIYGEGPLKNDIEKYILKKGLKNKIFLKGFNANIHYDIIDASLFVSTSNYEGISNSMLEALAIGLPVICTDCPIGGASLVIENNYNGILIKVGDKKALIKNMEDVLLNKQYANQISSHYSEIRNKFSAESIITQWISFVEELL